MYICFDPLSASFFPHTHSHRHTYGRRQVSHSWSPNEIITILVFSYTFVWLRWISQEDNCMYKCFPSCAPSLLSHTHNPRKSQLSSSMLCTCSPSRLCSYQLRVDHAELERDTKPKDCIISLFPLLPQVYKFTPFSFLAILRGDIWIWP